MFSSLRQDSIIYILDKKNKPALSTGRVISVSAITPKYPTSFNNPLGNIETTVDITVNMDGVNMDFKKIPSSLSIYGDNGFVISETKEAMISEIEMMKNNSKNIIESIEYHKSILDSCDEMLEKLNPNLAKEKENELKMNSLETRMSNIETVLAEMNDTLKTMKGN